MLFRSQTVAHQELVQWELVPVHQVLPAVQWEQAAALQVQAAAHQVQVALWEQAALQVQTAVLLCKLNPQPEAALPCIKSTESTESTTGFTIVLQQPQVLVHLEKALKNKFYAVCSTTRYLWVTQCNTLLNKLNKAGVTGRIL